MSGILCAQTGGLPNYKGSATVTVGTLKITNFEAWGWLPGTPDPGAISPSTWADSGLLIDGIDYRIVTFSGTQYRVLFFVNGYAPNIGWTTLTIAGNTYQRADAAYTYNGTQTSWNWITTSTNPFGTTVGATKAVSWS